MTWAKIDDQFHAHRKAKRAWKGHPRALGLHLLAFSYCAGHLTDGLVDDEFVEEKLPQARERDAVTAALVDAGLWAREEEGWRINDWLDFNPSRADVLDGRRKDSERKARNRGSGIQAASGRNPSGLPAESNGSPDDPSRARAFPDPTRPDQLPPLPPASGRGRQRDREKLKREALSWARSVGVDGPDDNLLRALTQARDFQRVQSADEFRAFAGQHFESLSVAV